MEKDNRMVRGAKLVLVAVTVAVLAGCAGTVKQVGSAPDASVARVAGISKVDVQMSAEAAKLQADNTQFSRDELAGFVRRKLEGKGLVAGQSNHRVEIEVTKIRVRSAVAAIMLGFMAGDDRIEGRVRLLDANGAPRQTFEVSSSYALGGFAGGQDGLRMNWLYEKFAELAVLELEKAVAVPTAANLAAAEPKPVMNAVPVAVPTAMTPSVPAVPAVSAAATEPQPARADATAAKPAASGFARLDNASAVPGLDDKGRAFYRDWLSRKNPRAFVVAEQGRYFGSWSTTPKDRSLPRDPLERALKNCRDAGLSGCVPYAVNDDVVYTQRVPVASH